MKKIAIGLSLISVLCSGSIASATVTPEDYGRIDAIQSKISAKIQGNERQVITQAMQGLAVEDQENVIYVSQDGTVYANKPELKSEMVEFNKISDNLFEDPQGNRFSLPSQTKPTDIPMTPTTITYTSTDNIEVYGDSLISPLSAPYPEPAGGSGPYRRVYSKPNYSWSSAYVYLPGGTNVKDSNGPGGQNGDAAFIYLGGWGNTGSAVDAGFIHGTTNSDWAPMIQINGTPYGQSVRLAENQNVYFKFLVSANNKITMAFSGIQKSTGTQISRTYVYDAPGFSLSGGNIIKRMTTIGQTSENFYTGSYVRNVHWYNTYIGMNDSSYHAWTSADQATDKYLGYHSYPDPARVFVNFVNAGEETDSIVLQ